MLVILVYSVLLRISLGFFLNGCNLLFLLEIRFMQDQKLAVSIYYISRFLILVLVLMRNFTWIKKKSCAWPTGDHMEFAWNSVAAYTKHWV